MGKKSIITAQQEFADNCGFGQEIIWDLLSSNDAEQMKNKIKHLIPDQAKGQNIIENLRNSIFRSVWKQRKYTNGTSISYIFYVMVTKKTNYRDVLNSTEYSCHPVFRCKKCDKNSDTSRCCMIYVDETGRVYQNWQSFKEENVLPAGTMVAPRRGVYNFDSNNKVILDVVCTPNGTPEARAMEIAQTGSAFAGLGAACVPVAAIFLPVAAPVVALAGFVGLGVGAFTSITSFKNLEDRQKHGQSISLTNREARASYLGIVGGAVGMAGAGATRAMSKMAAAGKATAGIEVLVNGINISSILISGSGVANGVLDLIVKLNDDDEISKLEILQLSASLVLFTHSVYNFQLASQIANNARDNSIKSYREGLSNRQRKMFDKMSKETMRIRGGTQGKMDIIRGANEIPDRQYLNDLFKINKKLNQQNVRPSFGEGGKTIVLNNEVPVNMAELRQSVQHQQGPDILGKVSQPIPATQKSDATPKEAGLFYSNGNCMKNIDLSGNSGNILNWAELVIRLPCDVCIPLGNYGKMFIEKISDGHKFKDVVLCMTEHFALETVEFCFNLAQVFIEKLAAGIQQELKLFIPTESVLYRIVKHILVNYTDESQQFISTKKKEILQAVKNYFLNLNPNNANNKPTICPDCQGSISICTL